MRQERANHEESLRAGCEACIFLVTSAEGFGLSWRHIVVMEALFRFITYVVDQGMYLVF